MICDLDDVEPDPDSDPDPGLDVISLDIERMRAVEPPPTLQSQLVTARRHRPWS